MPLREFPVLLAFVAGLGMATTSFAEERQRLLCKDGGGIRTLVFSPDGKTLATSQLRYLTFWNIEKGDSRAISVVRTMTQVAFASGGKVLVGAESDRVQAGPATVVRHWDVAEGKLNESFVLEEGGANWAIAADGKYLVTVRGFPNKVAKLWDLKSRKEIAALDGDDRNVVCAAISPDCRVVATGGATGTLRRWELPSGKMRAEIQLSSGVKRLLFSPDSKLIVAMPDPPGLPWHYHFFELASGKESGQRARINGVAAAFSPDGKILAATRSNWVEFWSVEKRTLIEKRTSKAERNMSCIAFAPDGKTVATGTGGMVFLWDVPKLKEP